MLKKSFTFILINLINLFILTCLLLVWVDPIEETFNKWILEIEALKLIGCSLFILLSTFLFDYVFIKRKTTKINSIKSSTVITLILSSFFYYNYSNKIYLNRVKNKDLRERLFSKIKPSNLLSQGTKADNLSYEEYFEITKSCWFPEIQQNADSISYVYAYDGFLPDYIFSVSYNLSLDDKIDTSKLTNGTIQLNKIGDKKRLVYKELLK